jgi:hypothetical protein
MQHGLHGKFGRDLWRIEQVGFVHLSNSSKHNNLVVHSDIFYDDDLDDFFHKYSIFNYNHFVLSITTPLHLQPVLVLRQLQRRLPLPRREFMAPLCTMRSQDKFANNEIATTITTTTTTTMTPIPTPTDYILDGDFEATTKQPPPLVLRTRLR